MIPKLDEDALDKESLPVCLVRGNLLTEFKREHKKHIVERRVFAPCYPSTYRRFIQMLFRGEPALVDAKTGQIWIDGQCLSSSYVKMYED